MSTFFRGTWPIYKRELLGYFLTPVAYVFIVIFLLMSGAFTFSSELGNFYELNRADLSAFFQFLPWLLLFLVPAVSMRLWAEERKQGTLELLMTLPVSLPAAVVGKFLAAWTLTVIALALTFPLWLTVNALGRPDNGAIFAGYVGAALMAGGYMAIGSAVSALTRNQVIAFVVSVVICFLFLLAAYTPVMGLISGWAPRPIVDTVGSFSFLTQFDAVSKGVVSAPSVIFFVSCIATFLFATGVIVDAKKAS